jgi:hypothetical protein
MATRMLAKALVVTAFILTTGAANANPISDLFNTGVDSSGVALADSTVGDPHYTLFSVPAGSTTDLLVRTAVGYPLIPGLYFTGDNSSAWIGPNNDYPGYDHPIWGPAGYYDFQTTFSLAGLDPTTAMISGGWSTDNNGVRILLNGVDTGNAGTLIEQFRDGFASFSITGGFISGTNTLDFIVNNYGGPTALRVDMSGSADVAAVPVPEPETYALMMAGLGLMGTVVRRRKSKKS